MSESNAKPKTLMVSVTSLWYDTEWKRRQSDHITDLKFPRHKTVHFDWSGSFNRIEAFFEVSNQNPIKRSNLSRESSLLGKVSNLCRETKLSYNITYSKRRTSFKSSSGTS